MDTDTSCDDADEATFSGVTGRLARLRENPLDPDEAGTLEYSLYETRAAAAHMLIWMLVGLTAYTFSAGVALAQQEVGGDGCSTLTENFAQNGVPMLQRIVFVVGVSVVVAAMGFWIIHKTPGKLEEDINWAKRGVAGIGVALLAPSFIQLLFGDIFGFSFAECVTGGLGFL